MRGQVNDSLEAHGQQRNGGSGGGEFGEPLLDVLHSPRRSTAGMSYSRPPASPSNTGWRPAGGGGDLELGGGGAELGGEDLRQTASRYLAREQAHGPRLLARGEVLGQSHGRWNIEHDWGRPRGCCSLARVQGIFGNARQWLYMTDPFHTIVNLSSWKVLTLCVMMYVVAWFVFAIPYYYLSQQSSDDHACGLVDSKEGADRKHPVKMSFLDAFFFSVETMATIGYSAPSDIFFDGCASMGILISAQTVVGLGMDAVLLGVIFNRMSRGSPRAKTILFSDRAVVRKIRGRYHLMFQVCEMRKHALVEAHVRMYCVRKDHDHLATGSVAYFQPFAMRLQHPDDELGGMLMMNLPNIVVHALDAWSPLVPHPVDLRLWRDPGTPRTEEEEAYNPAADCRFPDVLQRHIDCDQGNRTHITCEFCGESFWARRQLERHMEYCAVAERTAGHDLSLMCKTCGEQFTSAQGLRRHIATSETCESAPEGWAGDDDEESRSYSRAMHKVGGRQESVGGDSAHESRELIEAWLHDTQAEIIVLVEGIDATTSSTIQARHSYTCSEIVWDATFAQTVFPAPHGTYGPDRPLYTTLFVVRFRFDCYSILPCLLPAGKYLR